MWRGPPNRLYTDGGALRKGKGRRRRTGALPVMEIAALECALAKFFGGLNEGELKLPDYVRLAEMESLADEGGSQELRIRWVTDRDDGEFER